MDNPLLRTTIAEMEHELENLKELRKELKEINFQESIILKNGTRHYYLE